MNEVIRRICIFAMSNHTNNFFDWIPLYVGENQVYLLGLPINPTGRVGLQGSHYLPPIWKSIREEMVHTAAVSIIILYVITKAGP